MIEPEQHEVAGPPAGDTESERPVHLATADGRGGVVDEFNGGLTVEAR